MNYYLTENGAGLKDGTSWDNAFSLSEYIDFMLNEVNPGDTIYVLSGTYIFTSNISFTRIGSKSGAINIIGVSDTDLTPATKDDRPLFNIGNYYFMYQSYQRLYNLRIDGMGTYGIFLNNAYIKNSKITCSGAYSVYIAKWCTTVERCEIINTKSNGTVVYASGGNIDSCIISGGEIGISRVNGYQCNITKNIIYNTTTAIRMSGASSNCRHTYIYNNTIYNVTNGLYFAVIYPNGAIYVKDNIFHTLTNCQVSDTDADYAQALIDNNSFYNYINLYLLGGDGTPFTMINNLTDDPKLKDPANGDFSLEPGSPYINSGTQNPYGRG